MTPAEIFDALAEKYDDLWTCATIGRMQREAFWKYAGPYLRQAARVLDIGCGTGEDAMRLLRRGVQVTAIDVAPQMIAIARSRGVDARIFSAEDLAWLSGRFDAAISNFGPLNCVPDLSAIHGPLARMIEPGGHAILCLLNRFCLWEAAWFLLKAEPRKASRRWRGEADMAGLRVHYPTVRQILRSLAPEFTLVGRFGIGIAVPPSYVRLPESALRLAARFDDRLAGKPLFRTLGDHTLLILRRV